VKERQHCFPGLNANPSFKDAAVRWLSSIDVPPVVGDATGNMVAGAISGGILRQTWDQ
jgi:hypothetical protein